MKEEAMVPPGNSSAVSGVRTIMLSSADTLRERAAKIVEGLPLHQRPDTAPGFILAVFDVLEIYQRLDAEAQRLAAADTSEGKEIPGGTK